MTNANLPNRPSSASTTAVVAQNLFAARKTLGWSQVRLAEASGVSRATIVQLEAGLCDPRLSTVELLARAMSISPAFLLFGDGDLHAISELPRESSRSPAERRAMEALDRAASSTHYRSRLEAAMQGVDIITRAGMDSAVQRVGAAIGAARLASRGIFIGADLARLMDRYQKHLLAAASDANDHASDNLSFTENI